MQSALSQCLSTLLTVDDVSLDMESVDNSLLPTPHRSSSLSFCAFVCEAVVHKAGLVTPSGHRKNVYYIKSIK